MTSIPNSRSRRQCRGGISRRLLKRHALTALLVGALAAGACDETFTPIEASSLHLTVFGYLDASADTQWIRVTPLRPVLPTEPEPIGATVTLENTGTGRVFVLRDSTFRFTQHNPDVGSEGVYLHNFWTTEPIEPGATYLFSATLGDVPSEAVLPIPAAYGTEVWLSQTSSRRDLLQLIGLNHAAYIMIKHSYDDCGALVEREILNSASAGGDTLAIPIRGFLRSRSGCGPPHLERREILVIGSATEWPAGLEYSPSALGGSDTPSNVSNAVGFLGGINTRLLPYEGCRIEGSAPDPQPYCRLRYDSASVTLRGTVSDVVCGGTVPQAMVVLREIHDDPRALRRVRPTESGRLGGFEIGALEGGQRYALGVRRLDREGHDLFQEYGDTLQFAPGEQRTRDVELRPLKPCGTN